MTENKRFWSEDYSVGYYTEIVDNDKKLADVPNPKKNLTLDALFEQIKSGEVKELPIVLTLCPSILSLIVT